MIFITGAISIPENELEFSYSRSPGPGGQHVNTAATKVTLRFNVARSSALSQLEKMLVTGKLRRRMTKDGVLVIQSHGSRSQEDNRKEAVKRFQKLLADALTPVLERISTRVSRTQKRKRLDRKKQRSSVKRLRKRVKPGEDG